MKKIGLICLLPVLFFPLSSLSSELTLTAKQIQSLGVITSNLPAKQTGELAGMPAQVVIPGNQLMVVSAPLPALVEQTLVGVGDSVKKGQVLARLQSPALAEAQRGFLQASTQEQLAQENLNRDEQLWKEGIIAESRYRVTRSAQIEAHAALAERRQMLRLAGMPDAAIKQLPNGNNLSSALSITAPLSGIILEKSVSAGQRLDAAMPMFKVAQLNPLNLEIQAPLAATHGLKVGAAVNVPAFGASGKLTAIGRSLSGGNQTILLRAQLQHGTESLRPGQFVEASIATDSNASAQWNVPNSALARLDGKVLMFTATPKGFRSIEVTVLQEGAQSSAVTGRLNGDEKIAVRGVSALKASLMGIGGSAE